MRSKATLALIEQVIMLLVFALAVVLCLRAFVWADARSRSSALRDQALVQAQSAAEVLKNCDGDFAAASELWGGSWDKAAWTVSFDAEWKQTDGEGSYLLRVSPKDGGLQYLGAASVEVFEDGLSLAVLDVAWQEVGSDG